MQPPHPPSLGGIYRAHSPHRRSGSEADSSYPSAARADLSSSERPCKSVQSAGPSFLRTSASDRSPPCLQPEKAITSEHPAKGNNVDSHCLLSNLPSRSLASIDHHLIPCRVARTVSRRDEGPFQADGSSKARSLEISEGFSRSRKMQAASFKKSSCQA